MNVNSGHCYFSLILPSRKRPDLLRQLCESVDKNTSDLSGIEMLVAYDLDDPGTVCCSYPWLQFHGRERGNSISRDYQNWLFPRCRGDYVFVLNDDVEIRTPGWDRIALEKLCDQDVVYGWTSDSDVIKRFGNSENAYACFPILGRRGIELLGYVMHEHYGGWSADCHLYDVYYRAGKVTDLSEILAYHNSHWLGLREKDETSESMRQKSGNTDMIDVSGDAAKLTGFLLL